MADNVVRRDVIEVSWNIDDSPLKKLTKQAQEFQQSVKKSVGGSESELNEFAKTTQKSTAEMRKLTTSVTGGSKAVRRMKADIAQTDAYIAKMKASIVAVKLQIELMKFIAGDIKDRFKAMMAALKPSNVLAKMRAQLQAIKNAAIAVKNSIVQNVQHFKALGKQKLTGLINNIREVKNTLTGGEKGAQGFKNALKNIAKISFAETVNGIKRIGTGIKNAGMSVKNFATNIKTNIQNGFQSAINKGKQFIETLKKIDREKLKNINDSVNKLGKKLGSGLVSASKKALGALKNLAIAGGAAISGMVGFAVNGYADYEQLVGGVETLFGAGGASVEEYAKSVGKTVDSVKGDYDKLMEAQGIVMKNANDAYKTAGLSANDYMETVTGFAAALKQSLGGDTVKAAKKADVALTDMADNSNKMGTDMESIQYAYQGFAKQNYTMLDNLKLGYGGTKEEMERLLKDAQKLTGQKYDLSSYADIVDAIHAVQTELGITGTTAKEASTTIQGSVNAMKSAWSNFVAGMADPDQDSSQLVNNLVNSVVTAVKNIVPRIAVAVPRLAEGLRGIFSQLFTLAMQNINVLGPLAPIVQSIVGVFTQLKAKFAAVAADSQKMATIKAVFASIKSIAGNVVSIVGQLAVKIAGFVTSASSLNFVKSIFSGISKVIGFVKNNLGGITEIVIAVGGAFLIFGAAVKVVSAAVLAYTTIMKVVKTVQAIAAAAQMGFNAALLACPVTWIVAAIIGLIAVIILLVRNWGKVSAAAGKCWDFIKGLWSGVSGWFKSSVVQPVARFFKGLWDDLPAPVKGVVTKIFDAFKWAYGKVKDAWSGLGDFFSGLWKGVVKAVATPVNKLIDGANWVMDKLGSKKHFDDWKPYAKGTNGHPGGNAMVNDGRGAELVQMPNGATFIPRGRNVMLPNAPKGMKVLDADRTAQLMGRKSPTFNYADGTEKKGWLSDVWEFFDNAKGLVGKVIDKYVSYKGMSGYAVDAGKAIIKSAKSEMVSWVKGLFEKSGGKSLASYNPSKGVEQWKSTVIKALGMEGLSGADNVKRTLYQMQTESGGNPRAINKWDSNAKKGTPSKGLMQVIDPTFKSYARKGYAKNIYDPLSNILASLRYAKSRYGSLAKAYQGHGYASGVGAAGIRLPVYSPASSVGASSTSYSRETNNYSPSFSLTMNGTTDRTTERTIKKWVYEAIQETFESMERANPRVQEV